MPGHHGPASVSIADSGGIQGIPNAGGTPVLCFMSGFDSDGTLGAFGPSMLLADSRGWVRVRIKDWGTSTRVTLVTAGTLIFTGEVSLDRIILTNRPAGINSVLTVRDGVNGAAPIVWTVDGASFAGCQTLEFHRKLDTGLFYEMAGTVIGEWVLEYRRNGFD